MSLADSYYELHSSLCLHVSATQASNFRSVRSTQTWRQHLVPCEPSTHLSSPVEQESHPLLNAPAPPNSSAFSLAHAVCSLLQRHLRQFLTPYYVLQPRPPSGLCLSTRSLMLFQANIHRAAWFSFQLIQWSCPETEFWNRGSCEWHKCNSPGPRFFCPSVISAPWSLHKAMYKAHISAMFCRSPHVQNNRSAWCCPGGRRSVPQAVSRTAEFRTPTLTFSLVLPGVSHEAVFKDTLFKQKKSEKMSPILTQVRLDEQVRGRSSATNRHHAIAMV